jgi:hypothetical protein
MILADWQGQKITLALRGICSGGCNERLSAKVVVKMGVMKLALSRMDFLGGQNRFYPVSQTNHWREEPAEVSEHQYQTAQARRRPHWLVTRRSLDSSEQ